MMVRFSLAVAVVLLFCPTGAGAYSGKQDCVTCPVKQECLTSRHDTYGWSASPMLKKLGRGFSNVVGSPLEIPETIKAQERASEDTVANFVTGTVLGTGYAVRRFGVGVYEVFTFFAPERRPILPTLRFFHVDRKRI